MRGASRAVVARLHNAIPNRFSSRTPGRYRLLLVAIAALAGVLVYLIAIELFPYHSINHDEGVYLQQAAMLLDGMVWMEPPVPDAVRPWFFIEDGGRLYPKYSPVAAAIFAPALAVGAPRLTLAAIAIANVGLVGLLAQEAFDKRVGVLAAGLVLTAPLFLLNSAVFLSYAPTTALNLLFALAYVRAHRRESLRAAVLAGAAVGLAFFSRPYTTLLFALPFVVHAVVTLGLVWMSYVREEGPVTTDAVRNLTVRQVAVALVGACFVVLTFAYNWVLTGSPLVFPYEAFAPADGIGFGHRQILGHEREYTPSLALEVNRRVLWQFFTRWGPLGAVGTGLAGVGLVSRLAVPLWNRYAQGDRGSRRLAAPTLLSDLTCRCLLAALVVTVAVGNVFFWGNLNILAALEDPTDGLIAYLGPFYHFDILVPVSIFGAAGMIAIGERIVESSRKMESPHVRTVLLTTMLVGSLVIAGSAGASAVSAPIEDNSEYRDHLTAVYEPFETTDRTNALVFVPDPFGHWLNHPFQWLRNDPAFESDTVYVLDRSPEGDAASLAAFADRDPYRFTYRGTWPPATDGVTPVVERLEVREGEQLHVETTVGVVAGAQGATIRLASENGSVQYGVETLQRDTLSLQWSVDPDAARVDSPGLRRYSDNASVSIDGPSTVTMAVTFTQPGGSTVTYRQELTVLETNGSVRVLWPPVERVCRLTTDCGRVGTYVEGEDYATGVSLSSNVTAG